MEAVRWIKNLFVQYLDAPVSEKGIDRFLVDGPIAPEGEQPAAAFDKFPEELANIFLIIRFHVQVAVVWCVLKALHHKLDQIPLLQDELKLLG